MSKNEKLHKRIEYLEKRLKNGAETVAALNRSTEVIKELTEINANLREELSKRNNETIDLEDTIFDIVNGTLSVENLNAKEIVAQYVVKSRNENNQ